MGANRPGGFNVAVVAVVLQAVIPYLESNSVFRFQSILSIPFTVLYIFFFWSGRPWARIIVLLVSLAGFILLYLDLSHGNNWGTIQDLIRLPFDVFLLYWLNTRAVKAYFAQRTTIKRE